MKLEVLTKQTFTAKEAQEFIILGTEINFPTFIRIWERIGMEEGIPLWSDQASKQKEAWLRLDPWFWGEGVELR